MDNLEDPMLQSDDPKDVTTLINDIEQDLIAYQDDLESLRSQFDEIPNIEDKDDYNAIVTSLETCRELLRNSHDEFRGMLLENEEGEAIEK